MTEFYTKVFTVFVEILLTIFTVGSLFGAAYVAGYADTGEEAITEIIAFGGYWLALAACIGLMTLVVSFYNKLCKLVELQEKALKQAERVEPTIL